MDRACFACLRRNGRFAFADWWEARRLAGRVGFTLRYVIPVYAGFMLGLWFVFNLQVQSWSPLIWAFDSHYLGMVLLLYPLLGYILGSWVFWFLEKTYRRIQAEEQPVSDRAAAWGEERKKGILYHVVLRGMMRDGLVLLLFFAGQPLPYVLNLYAYTVSVSARVPGSLSGGSESLESFLFGPFLWYLIIPAGALVGASLYYWRFEIAYRSWAETKEGGQ